MAPFIVAQGNFNVPEYLFAHFADSGSKDSNRFRRVPVEYGQEVLMLESRFRVQLTPRQQRIFQADGGGFAKGCTYVKIIISIQITAVNDTEDVPAVFQPIDLDEMIGNAMELAFQPFCGWDIIMAFQGVCGGGFIM